MAFGKPHVRIPGADLSIATASANSTLTLWNYFSRRVHRERRKYCSTFSAFSSTPASIPTSLCVLRDLCESFILSKRHVEKCVDNCGERVESGCGKIGWKVWKKNDTRSINARIQMCKLSAGELSRGLFGGISTVFNRLIQGKLLTLHVINSMLITLLIV